MNSPEQITTWIQQLRQGDSRAAQKLWEIYFQQMVELARRKLQGARKGIADEEDVALSAFKSFCLGAREGRFTQLEDRESLWPLLVSITANKSIDLVRYENRKKRAMPQKAGEASQEFLSELISREPSPEFALQLAEELELFLTRLEKTGDEELKQIALSKMEGETNSHIAEQLGCTRRTVERKLQLILRICEQEGIE
ncbi:MAG: sigma-70 family RNA polymerase sigma factor [Planctomycetaceae bacterium]|nr:sigma-70 family RNA polymerase sigma factor [Planctomycetaceae bacterium]